MILIAAVSASWGIGRDNNLLFSLPADMRRFRALTTGGAVIMGRKTFESLPGRKPLPNRLNIILTREPGFCPPAGAFAASGPDSLPELTAGYPADRVFVIGGEAVYRLLLPLCDKAYITKVESDPSADRFIPDLDRAPDWKVEREEPPLEQSGLRFRYVTYVRSV